MSSLQTNNHFVWAYVALLWCGADRVAIHIVRETRAQIWPNLAPEYICCFMIDSLSPDSSLFKSAGCQTVNFGHLILFAFEKKK